MHIPVQFNAVLLLFGLCVCLLYACCVEYKYFAIKLCVSCSKTILAFYGMKTTDHVAAVRLGISSHALLLGVVKLMYSTSTTCTLLTLQLSNVNVTNCYSTTHRCICLLPDLLEFFLLYECRWHHVEITKETYC